MNLNIGIVVSEFNKEISDNLLRGANSVIDNSNDNINVNIYTVPGAFEIPGLINQILKSKKKYDAIIGFGCVIKGETSHFDYISQSVSNALSKLSIREATNIPILFGILTTYNKEQAIIRSLVDKKNKGGEVMQAAIDSIKSYQNVKKF